MKKIKNKNSYNICSYSMILDNDEFIREKSSLFKLTLSAVINNIVTHHREMELKEMEIRGLIND